MYSIAKRVLPFLLLLSTLAWADGSLSTTFLGTGQSITVKNAGTGIAYHKLTFTKSGTVTVCSVRVDSSSDGTTWNAGDVIGATDCSSNGSTTIASDVVGYIRVNVTSFTGTGSVNVVWDGFVSNPGNGTSITITDDNATNATMYPLWVTANAGDLPPKVSSTGLTWNPSTQTLSAPFFSGTSSVSSGTSPTTCGSATGCFGATAADTVGSNVAGEYYMRAALTGTKWLWNFGSGEVPLNVASGGTGSNSIGSDTQVLFNDVGAVAGNAGAVYDKTLQKLSIIGNAEFNGWLSISDTASNSIDLNAGVISAEAQVDFDAVSPVGNGFSVTSLNHAQANITSVLGFFAIAGGAVTTASSFTAETPVHSSGTIVNSYGYDCQDLHGIGSSSSSCFHSPDQGTGANDHAIEVAGGQSVLPSIATGNSANRDLAGQLTLSSGTKTQASTYLYVSPRICVASSTAATPVAVQVTNAVASTGAIKASTLNAAGTGYIVGDVGTVDGGTGATYRVDTLSGSGVATYTITAPGTGSYSVAAAVTTTATSGAGTGFKINVTVIAGVDTLTLTVPGGSNTDTYNYICVGRD